MSVPEPKTLPHLVAGMVGGVVLGAVLVAALDGLFAVLGRGEFGELTGFLAVIPAMLLLHAEHRAWPALPGRLQLNLICVPLSGVPALGVMFELVGGWPRLLSGALGAVVFVVFYAVLWYTGMRWLEQRRTS